MQQFLWDIFNDNDWPLQRKLTGYGTPGPPGEICFIQQMEYGFLYLVDLNSILSQYLFVQLFFQTLYFIFFNSILNQFLS